MIDVWGDVLRPPHGTTPAFNSYGLVIIYQLGGGGSACLGGHYQKIHTHAAMPTWSNIICASAHIGVHVGQRLIRPTLHSPGKFFIGTKLFTVAN